MPRNGQGHVVPDSGANDGAANGGWLECPATQAPGWGTRGLLRAFVPQVWTPRVRATLYKIGVLRADSVPLGLRRFCVSDS